MPRKSAIASDSSLRSSGPLSAARSEPTKHRAIVGDSRWMPELADESVHLVATSPPYWQLKDYGHEGQIGFDDTYEEYVNNLNLVWDECRRVLHPGCRLCVNVGDQFARSVYYGRYKVIPIRTEIVKFCEAAGFDFMGSIVWRKVTTTNTTGGAVVMGSYPYPRNGIVKIDYEHILLFKKYGEAPKPAPKQKEASRLTDEEWNAYFAGHWSFPGERQDGHLAMFPEELPRRLIKMFTFVGETVLDPFLGSGTTSLAALHLGRSSVGYEINPEFLPLIREKVAGGMRDTGCGMSNEACGFEGSGLGGVEVVRRSDHPDDIEERLARLPYVFRDPVRIDKRVDPREMGFGSKVAAERDKPAGVR